MSSILRYLFFFGTLSLTTASFALTELDGALISTKDSICGKERRKIEVQDTFYCVKKEKLKIEKCEPGYHLCCYRLTGGCGCVPDHMRCGSQNPSSK